MRTPQSKKYTKNYSQHYSFPSTLQVVPTITPHLWFDTQAKEAAEFYVSVFSNSAIQHVSMIKDTPSGDCDIVSFTVRGMQFQAISAGPYFKLNPAISFMINYDPSRDADPRKELDAAWEKLMDSGKALMPLDTYPFSERYGWVQDKFGVSWQLILTNPEGEDRPEILPAFLFTNERYGQAEEAMNFYLSVFKDAKQGAIAKYGPGMEPNKEGTVMFEDFKLLDTWFAAMDGGGKHEFGFNEAVSFMVHCETQEEIDYYWEKLSAVPASEQCGWLKDKFGVSWQIVPTTLGSLMGSGNPEKTARVTEAFLKMKKFDIQKLHDAFDSIKENQSAHEKVE